MERLLFECAVRVTLIAAGTAAVLWAFRIKTAAARHNAWTGVVVLMLLLPIWTVMGPRVSLRVLQPATVPAAPATAPPSNWLPSPAAPPAAYSGAVAIAEPTRTIDWKSFLLGVYVLGASTLLARLLLGMVQAQSLIRNAVVEDGHRTSGSCFAPITVGWFKPVVILPRDWQQWPKAQLDAVLTHEREHVQRRDPLIQWLALVNRAIFWFHPLAWWLERRLAALAEGACDAAVLAAGHEPQDYSEYLLDLARSTMRQGKRVRVIGMAMPGRFLTHRIRQIFNGVPLQPISRTRIVCTVALFTISSVVFTAATLAPKLIEPIIPKTAVVGPTFTEPVAQTLIQAPLSLELPETNLTLPNPPQQDPGQSLLLPVLQVIAPLENTAAPQNPNEPRTVQREELHGLVTILAVSATQDSLNRLNFTLTDPSALRTRISESLWPNVALLGGLGLSYDQRASIDRVVESYRQKMASATTRLEMENAQLTRFLEIEPVDSGAISAQSDRVIQARSELERTTGAMIVEVRQYLTQAQWVQWQAAASMNPNVGRAVRLQQRF